MANYDYGIIGNCSSAALISSDCSIDWLCLPSFDSTSLFARILDEKSGGFFRISGVDTVRTRQEYVRHTAILRTIVETNDGAFEVNDYMPRFFTPRRDFYCPSEIHRHLRVVSGKPMIRVEIDARPNYALGGADYRVKGDYLKTYLGTFEVMDISHCYGELKLIAPPKPEHAPDPSPEVTSEDAPAKAPTPAPAPPPAEPSPTCFIHLDLGPGVVTVAYRYWRSRVHTTLHFAAAFCSSTDEFNGKGRGLAKNRISNKQYRVIHSYPCRMTPRQIRKLVLACIDRGELAYLPQFPHWAEGAKATWRVG